MPFFEHPVFLAGNDCRKQQAAHSHSIVNPSKKLGRCRFALHSVGRLEEIVQRSPYRQLYRQSNFIYQRCAA
jgi:hypothetical protein